MFQAVDRSQLYAKDFFSLKADLPVTLASIVLITIGSEHWEIYLECKKPQKTLHVE